ncbi:hypothetical protein Nepgr_030458 [Nepenthes gracilis]|uniref:Uncharacterized protein n=1 Tax=Nepenthes gracilis TaxID=150966 RepID=A0AAD3TFD2_NEPGR|nr:hypothetical protein Nepgr_030458 [Nepenthes gracilis]
MRPLLWGLRSPAPLCSPFGDLKLALLCACGKCEKQTFGRFPQTAPMLRSVNLADIYKERDTVREATRGTGVSGLPATIAHCQVRAVMWGHCPVCRSGLQRRMAASAVRQKPLVARDSARRASHLSWHHGYFGFSGGHRPSMGHSVLSDCQRLCCLILIPQVLGNGLVIWA